MVFFFFFSPENSWYFQVLVLLVSGVKFLVLFTLCYVHLSISVSSVPMCGYVSYNKKFQNCNLFSSGLIFMQLFSDQLLFSSKNARKIPLLQSVSQMALMVL